MKTIIALKVRTIVDSWSLGNFNQDVGIKMVWLNFRLFPWEMQKMHFFHPKSCSNKIRKFPKVTKAEYQSLRINHLLKKFIGITVRTFSNAYEIAYWMKELIPENGSSLWNLKLFNFNSKKMYILEILNSLKWHALNIKGIKNCKK